MNSNLMRIGGDLSSYTTAATAGTGFGVPPMVLRHMMSRTYPPQAVGPLRVLYGGAVPGMTDPAYVCAHPVDKGRWFVQAHVGSGVATLMTTVDVMAPDAVLAVDYIGAPGGLLVIAASSAVKVEMRDPNTGALLHSLPTSRGAGVIPVRAAEDMALRAFDANGALVGTGMFPLTAPSVRSEQFMPELMERWN
jgi:hypothetical protein